jgi:hypothetical protein
MNWVKDENYRRELVLRGETFANVFLSYRRNYHESFGNIIDTKIQSNNRHETVTSVEPTVIHHDDSTFVDNTTPNVELEPAPAVEPQPDDESVSTNVPLLTKNSTFDVHNIDEPTMV